MTDTPRTATYLYLLFTLLFSAVIWTIVIWSGHLSAGFGLLIPAVMPTAGSSDWIGGTRGLNGTNSNPV